MSLRMISDVLKPRDVNTHCPLCGRNFLRVPSNQEHIFPRWLQRHHELWNRKLNIPNFLGKPYSSVKIRICKHCNGDTFGSLEHRIAPFLTDADPFAAAAALSDDELALWLGKISWLLIRKSHSIVDHRTLDSENPERIWPDDLLPGTLFLGMIERAFATDKALMSCFRGDPPIPELFYEKPFSLYRFRIDTRDKRFEAFDFADSPATLGLGFRTHTLGVVCLFDGGLHRRFRRPWYDFLFGEKLHPVQFAEVTARMVYDQTVLDDDAMRVTYYWNRGLHAVVAQSHTPRHFNPYMEKHHDSARLASVIARHTFNDPAQLEGPDGRVITSLKDSTGRFLCFPISEAELATARADPKQTLVGPMHAAWRTSKAGPGGEG
jgi:hypothetical protein